MSAWNMSATTRVQPRSDVMKAADVGNFFTVNYVADLLEVSPRTVRRWIERKQLIAHYFGKALRIAGSDLKAFIAAHRDA
jgi:excisionase family DNA binding protein